MSCAVRAAWRTEDITLIALQTEYKGAKLVDDCIVTELSRTIVAPTECLLIDDGTGMLIITTEAVNIGERCSIGHDGLDGIELIDSRAITELTSIISSPTPN